MEHISKEQLQTLMSAGTVCTFRKNELLFMEQDLVKHVFIVLEGVIKVYKFDSKSNEVILYYKQPYSFLGELPQSTTSLHYQDNAEAEGSAKVLKIALEDFVKLYEENMSIAQYVIAALNHRVRLLKQINSINIASNITEKVAMFIYEHEKLFSELKQYQIASILNVAPETLSRTVKKFKEQNIIQMEGKKPVLVNKEALREYFDFPYYGS